MSPSAPGRYEPRRTFRRFMGPVFGAACFLATLSGVVVLAVLLGAVVVTALGHREELGRPHVAAWNLGGWCLDLGRYLWSLARRVTSSNPVEDGYRVGIVGSLWLLGLVTAFAIPVGIGAAVFLEEFLPQSRVRRIIQTNIANLAGVPSVVYGLLGLAAFRNGFGSERFAIGASLWAGALTLSLLVLPVVVIATQEALRTVPQSLRQAALALGATRWLVVRDHVLPVALPGILTGTILALSRAIGETAPLLLVGAATSLLEAPRGPSDFYSALPVEIYSDAREPEEAFQTVASGGILLLLVMLLGMNTTAIFIRNRAGRQARG